MLTNNIVSFEQLGPDKYIFFLFLHNVALSNFSVSFLFFFFFFRKKNRAWQFNQTVSWCQSKQNVKFDIFEESMNNCFSADLAHSNKG